MRIIIFLLSVFLLGQPVLSQTKKEMQEQLLQTVTDLKKQIADLEKDIAAAKDKKEDPESIKGMENELAQLKQQLALMQSVNKGISGMSDNTFQQANETAPTGFPVKKIALLNALPKKTLTRQELIAFLVAYHNELKRRLDPEKVQGAMDIIAHFENNYAKMAMVGVAAWYNNAFSESVLLLTYAGSKSPDDLTLNNCGAILNLYGKEEKALPVLKYVLPHEPNNCTLLNNIGQAFAGLGELDSAMYYFGTALRICARQPEANATAARIAYSRGDTALAAKYMEQSLLGAYSEENMDFFKAIRPNYKPTIELDTKKYFVPKNFQPAPNCTNWDQCEKVTAIQNSTRKFLNEQRNKYAQIVNDNAQATMQAQLAGKTWKEGPLAKEAQYLKDVITDAYMDARQKATGDLIEEITRLTDRQTRERLALDEEFDPQYKACVGVGGNCLKDVDYKYCLRKEAMDNKYFSLLADAAQRFESVWYPKDVKYYNNMVYLISVNAMNDMTRKADCATFTNNLIDDIDHYVLCECLPIGKPNCVQPLPPEPEESLFPEFLEGECPINIRIPFIVGKVSLNCERFEFEAGEGLILKYERNFEHHESSFAVGFGVEENIPFVADGSATATVGFKWDTNNEVTDVFTAAKAEAYVKGWGTPIISGEARLGVSSGYTSTFTVMGR